MTNSWPCSNEYPWNVWPTYDISVSRRATLWPVKCATILWPSLHGQPFIISIQKSYSQATTRVLFIIVSYILLQISLVCFYIELLILILYSSISHPLPPPHTNAAFNTFISIYHSPRHILLNANGLLRSTKYTASKSKTFFHPTESPPPHLLLVSYIFYIG